MPVRPVVEHGTRDFEDGVLVSTDLPAMRLRVESRLEYLGASELEIKGIAHAERHHFLTVDGTRVKRMLVVQFEGFLPTNDEVYRYALPKPVSMGGSMWGTWVFAYSVTRTSPEPSPETVDTVRFLASKGLELEPEQLMARYARILGDDARHEVLIFYHEPLGAIGHTLETIAEPDGRLRPPFTAAGVELQARASRAFRIEA